MLLFSTLTIFVCDFIMATINFTQANFNANRNKTEERKNT